MPHNEHQIHAFKALDYEEGQDIVSTVSRRVKALPGRVAVLMDEVSDKFVGTDILVPGGKHSGKYRDDAGTVVSSGVQGIKQGDRVLVNPYDGLWMTDKDAAWVPEGREVRFFGVSSPWHDSLVAKLN